MPRLPSSSALRDRAVVQRSTVPRSAAQPRHLAGARFAAACGGTRPVLLSGLLVLLLALAGCSGGEDDDGAAPPATESTAEATASSEPAAGGTPEASRTSRIENEAGTVEIGFVELRVEGQLAQLDLLFTPRYRDDPATGVTLYDMAGRQDAAVTLVDATDLKRYTVVRDSSGAALGAGSGTTRTRNNVPVTASYTFAAPPAEVSTVDIYLNDQLIVDDAPISR